jgi:hypothetical protein
MIQIDGLNKRQVELLNRMWDLESLDDVYAWQATLPLEDQKTCETLIELVMYAFIDEQVDSGADLTPAREIIQKILKNQ